MNIDNQSHSTSNYKIYHKLDQNFIRQRFKIIQMNNFYRSNLINIVSTLRDPPNSREFKKTIPTTMI